MNLKNKIRRQLMSVKTENDIKIGDEIKFNDTCPPKILIDPPYQFVSLSWFDPEFSLFKDKQLKIELLISLK